MRRILLTLFLIFSNVVNATNISFAWESQPDYPPGVTYEFQANECAQSGITGTTTTCNLVGSPGDPLHAQVRAISPDSGQWSDSAWTKLDTVIPGVALLYTNPEAQTNLSVSRAGGVIVPATQVQKKSYRSTAPGSSHTITPNATPTSGNLLVLAVASDATVNTPSGWTSATSAVDFVGLYLFYKVSAGSETSIVVSPTSSAQTAVDFFEYSGMASSSPLDKTASNNTGVFTTSVPTGTTATTTQADELAIAAVGFGYGTAVSVSSWSNSYNEEADARTTSSGQLVTLATASMLLSSTAAATTTATLNDNSGHPSGVIATFKIAAGGSADLNPDFLITATVLQAVNTSNW